MPPPAYIRKEKEVCIVTCPETPARTHTKRAFCTRVLCTVESVGDVVVVVCYSQEDWCLYVLH